MSLVAPAAEAVSGNSLLTRTERQTSLERISIRFSIANLRTFPCVNILESRARLSISAARSDISTGELWVTNGKRDFRAPDIDRRRVGGRRGDERCGRM